MSAYCHHGYSRVAAAGYVPGVYIGWQRGLTGQQPYDLPSSRCWAAYNVEGVSMPHPRGDQLVQSCGSGDVGSPGTDVYDVDTTHVVAEGGHVLWLKQ